MRNFQKSILASLFTLLFCCPFVAISQNASWGIGFLEIHPTNHSFNIYDAPKGQPVGTFGFEENFSEAIWREERGISLAIPPEAYIKISMDSYGFVVTQQQNGFIQLLLEGAEGSAWVSIAELAKTSSKYSSWITFMSNSQEHFYALSYGMNVRAQPNAKAERITTAKGENFDIRLTGATEGLWAEVIILEYDSDYCDNDRKLIKESRGWMKVLDDAGYPNIWTGGYCC